MLVKYNEANIRDAYGMKLKPGINDVSPTHWELATKTHKDKEILALLESGALELLEKDEAPKSEEPVAKTESLKGFSEKKALELVKSTFDAEMLQLWKAGEDRQKVIVALEKQIEVMKKPVAKE